MCRRRLRKEGDEEKPDKYTGCKELATEAAKNEAFIREMTATDEPLTEILAKVLERIQLACYEKTIYHAQMIEGMTEHWDRFNLDQMVEAKQCLAYTEMAKRMDPELLIFNWILAPKSEQESYDACAKVVREVNDVALKSQIAGVVPDIEAELYEIEDHPLAEKVNDEMHAVMEAWPPLKNFLETTATVAVLATVMTEGAKMLALICKDYAQKAAQLELALE